MSGSNPAQNRGRRAALTGPGALFLTAALIVCALPAISPIGDPDFWWHLRAGQLIIQRHGLLGSDPFTYTAAAHHWTMHEWLTEVGFAYLHSIGGLAPIVLVLCALTWLGLLCIGLRARLHRPGNAALGTGLILASIAGAGIWGPRAQMITFALSCLLLLLVERHLLRGGRLIWCLVPVFLVWGNLHSGVLIGLGFLALVWASELLARWLRPAEAAPPARIRQLGLLLAACLAASLINPNGPSIVLYPFATQGSMAQQSVILEWHSPDFHRWEAAGFGLLLLSLVALFVLNRRVRVRDIALTGVTALLAMQSVRHIALFVAAASPVWIEQADLALRRLASRGSDTGRTTPAPRKVDAAPEAGLPLATLLATHAVVALALLAVVGARLGAAMGVREDSLTYARDYPVCAATWLAAAPPGLRIFNQYGEGGYLANRLASHGDRVFIFGDAALMGDPLLLDYSEVEAIRPRWQRVIRDSGTDIVLFDTGSPLTNVLEVSPSWTMVYQDPRSEAFVPRSRAGSLHLPGAVPDVGGTCGRLQREGLGSGQAVGPRPGPTG